MDNILKRFPGFIQVGSGNKIFSQLFVILNLPCMNKVLIVDDDTDFLYILRYVFKYPNYQVKLISKAEHALQEANNFKPDIILLDVHLDGSDGRDLCKKLKKDQLTANIPVIMISADSNKDDAILSGANDYYSKESRFSELLTKMNLYSPHQN